MNEQWKMNPAVQNIDPKKIEIMELLVNQSRGKNMEDILPDLMAASSRLAEQGIAFSNEETAAIPVRIFYFISIRKLIPSRASRVLYPSGRRALHDKVCIFYMIGVRHSKSRTEIMWKMSCFLLHYFNASDIVPQQ